LAHVLVGEPDALRRDMRWGDQQQAQPARDGKLYVHDRPRYASLIHL
jgi:hypothetical protein